MSFFLFHAYYKAEIRKSNDFEHKKLNRPYNFFCKFSIEKKSFQRAFWGLDFAALSSRQEGLSCCEAPFTFGRLQAPFKPPWSPLQAPFKPPWSLLKVKPPWSPFQAPSKPPSSPLQAPLKPPWSLPKVKPPSTFRPSSPPPPGPQTLQAPLKGASEGGTSEPAPTGSRGFSRTYKSTGGQKSACILSLFRGRKTKRFTSLDMFLDMQWMEVTFRATFFGLLWASRPAMFQRTDIWKIYMRTGSRLRQGASQLKGGHLLLRVKSIKTWLEEKRVCLMQYLMQRVVGRGCRTTPPRTQSVLIWKPHR